MPSIELKSIDRIKNTDRLLVNAGSFARAGKPISEKVIRLLAKHKVPLIPTISPSYEEKNKYADEAKLEAYLTTYINNRGNRFEELRNLAVEKLKSCYIPFKEEDRSFSVSGKKKQLTKNMLLEKEPGPLYRDDISAGSENLINPTTMNFLVEIVGEAYKLLDRYKSREVGEKQKKNFMPRFSFHNLRLSSFYEKDRLSGVGDAFVQQACDAAFLFLATMANINKRRILQQYPRSDARFDPEQSFTKDQIFCYDSDFIRECALGMMFQYIGFSHLTLHSIVSQRPIFREGNKNDEKKIRLLRRSVYVVQNLFRERSDVSSLSRMMINMQRLYPDGSGFPPINTNPFLHEFLRMGQIIDCYLEMTNPAFGKIPYHRMETIEYLQQNAGPYHYNHEVFNSAARFDENLLAEFLNILQPYIPGEKVYLYYRGKWSTPYFVGRVSSYLDSHLPLISILHDARKNVHYKYGQLLFYIPTATYFMMKDGKIVKKVQSPEISNLVIRDTSLGAGDPQEIEDHLWAKERVLSRIMKRRMQQS